MSSSKTNTTFKRHSFHMYKNKTTGIDHDSEIGPENCIVVTVNSNDSVPTQFKQYMMNCYLITIKSI